MQSAIRHVMGIENWPLLIFLHLSVPSVLQCWSLVSGVSHELHWHSGHAYPFCLFWLSLFLFLASDGCWLNCLSLAEKYSNSKNLTIWLAHVFSREYIKHAFAVCICFKTVFMQQWLLFTMSLLFQYAWGSMHAWMSVFVTKHHYLLSYFSCLEHNIEYYELISICLWMCRNLCSCDDWLKGYEG